MFCTCCDLHESPAALDLLLPKARVLPASAGVHAALHRGAAAEHDLADGGASAVALPVAELHRPAPRNRRITLFGELKVLIEARHGKKRRKSLGDSGCGRNVGARWLVVSDPPHAARHLNKSLPIVASSY